MLRQRLASVCLLAVAGLPSLVSAAEVVEFRDGRFLEVRAYTIQDDFVRLDLDRESFLVVPLAGIDSIRRDWRVVYHQQDRSSPAVESAREARPLLPDPRSRLNATVRHTTRPSAVGG